MVPPWTGVPLALVLAPDVLAVEDPPLDGVDDPLDEHAATASATPASGTAQRSLLGMERTALLCSTGSTCSSCLACSTYDCRLSTIDPWGEGEPTGRVTSASIAFYSRIVKSWRVISR